MKGRTDLSIGIGAFLGLALLMAGSAPADVLVMRDGSRVETEGPWEVKGRQILFKAPNGALSSIRASEVDLEASRAATDFKPPPPPPPPAAAEERPEPVLVLTNKDIPQASTEEEEADGTEEGPAKSPGEREPVQVVNWKKAQGSGGMEIRGTLRNTGRDIAANISLEVKVNDEEGNVAETAAGFLQSRSLVAGQSTTFRVVLTAVADFPGEPIFNVSSSGLRLGGTSFPGGRRASEAAADGTGGGSAGGGSAGSGGAVAGDGSAASAGDAGGGTDGTAEGRPSTVSQGPGFEETESSEISVDPDG